MVINHCRHLYFDSIYIQIKQTPIPSMNFIHSNVLLQYDEKDVSVTFHLIVVTQSLCFNTNELGRGSFKVAYQWCTTITRFVSHRKTRSVSK